MITRRTNTTHKVPPPTLAWVQYYAALDANRGRLVAYVREVEMRRKAAILAKDRGR